MGRKAIPIKLHKMQGTASKMGKEETAEREAVSVDLGGLELKIPQLLHGRKKASRRFKEIVELYYEGGLLLVTTADIDLLAEYCLNYENLCEAHALVAKFKTTAERRDNFDEYSRGLNNIDKLSTKLIKLAPLLYLTPESRARTGGKLPTEKKKSELEKKGFGNL